MKKLLLLLVCVALSASLLLPRLGLAKGDPNWQENAANAKKAQELKARGDYLGAARVHPYSLCRASYLWNHACSLIGKKNANNDWVYDAAKKANNEEALAFLAQAEQELDDPGDDPGEGRCTGADAGNLRTLIKLVREAVAKYGS
jgi:type II secretory pathway pseudopilin PulG